MSTLVLGWWLLHDPVKGFTEFHPGLDNRPDVEATGGDPLHIGEYFEQFNGVPSLILGQWPRFRGTGINNISPEKTELADNWESAGPPVLWSVDLGEGHSGAVIKDGRVYLLDYDEELRRDQLRCFSFDDGREIWRRGYDIHVKRNHGMSRTVPAVKNTKRYRRIF